MVCCGIVTGILGLLLPTSVTGVLLSTTLALSVWWYMRRPKNTPPGPRGIPLLGFIPFFKENPAKQLAELGDKYGPVVSFDLGGELVISITDLKLMRQALQDEAFAGRPDFEKELFAHKDKTMLFSEGMQWLEARKFAISILKEVGVGKPEIEPLLLEEVSNLMKYVGDKKSRPFDIRAAVTASVGDIMTKITMGERFDYDDPTYAELVAGIYEQFKCTKMTGFTAAFPWMRAYPVFRMLGDFELSEKCTKKHLEVIQKRIDDHKKNYFAGKRDDFIDTCIAEKELRTKSGNHPELFADEAVLYDVHVLQAVTTGAVSSFLTWAFIYATAHPDIQRKIQTEIDEVMGSDRQPTYDDRTRMPYTEAFTLEVHRTVSLLPFYHPHRTVREASLGGYTIPVHTTVLPNAWAVHHDPKLWNDPESFRPERFINDQGQVVKSDHLFPFGFGKRGCGGEALARSEIFLYFTAMFQKFTLLPVEGQCVSVQGLMALFNVPPAPMMRAVPREQ